jgi:hypothetical protein
MSKLWDESIKTGKEMFYKGKTLAQVIIKSNDDTRAPLIYGYQSAKESFQGRNFDLEIQEQRDHFEGVDSTVM